MATEAIQQSSLCPCARSAVAKHHGFTLIEVLIVVAIIGVLAAIAYPQYGSFVQKGRRADAHLALMLEVQTLERCKSTRYSYSGCSVQNATSPEAYYNITLVNDANTYTVTATGVGAQASDPECSVMTVNHLGALTPDPDSSTCWPN